jgi:hypothetical protein
VQETVAPLGYARLPKTQGMLFALFASMSSDPVVGATRDAAKVAKGNVAVGSPLPDGGGHVAKIRLPTAAINGFMLRV